MYAFKLEQLEIGLLSKFDINKSLQIDGGVGTNYYGYRSDYEPRGIRYFFGLNFKIFHFNKFDFSIGSRIKMDTRKFLSTGIKYYRGIFEIPLECSYYISRDFEVALSNGVNSVFKVTHPDIIIPDSKIFEDLFWDIRLSFIYSGFNN